MFVQNHSHHNAKDLFLHCLLLLDIEKVCLPWTLKSELGCKNNTDSKSKKKNVSSHLKSCQNVTSELS